MYRRVALTNQKRTPSQVIHRLLAFMWIRSVSLILGNVVVSDDGDDTNDTANENDSHCDVVEVEGSNHFVYPLFVVISIGERSDT